MLNCNPNPNPPAPMTDDERRAYYAGLRASVAAHEAHVEEKRETLLHNVGALYDEHPRATAVRLIRAVCALDEAPATPGCAREFADAVLELVAEVELAHDEALGGERPSALLRGALDNQRPFEVSIEEAREAHPLLESDLDALDETTLDRIREQRYAAWGDSPIE